MATTKTSADTPTQIREQAEARLQERQQAAHAAQRAADDLRVRLADGDDSVTAAALSAADAEQERAVTLVEAAEKALTEAKIAESVHVARETAERVASTTFADTNRAVDSAVEELTQVLGKLRSSLNGSNGVLRKAMTAAADSGLREGSADPLSVVVLRRERLGFGPSAKTREILTVHGQDYSTVDVDATTRDTVTRALAELDIESSGGDK